MRARIKATKQMKQAVNDEVIKQVYKANNEKDDNYDAVVLWVLHIRYGWGEKRLKAFYDAFSEEFERLKEYYLLDNADTTFVIKQKLKEIGVDISEMNAKKRKEYGLE